MMFSHRSMIFTVFYSLVLIAMREADAQGTGTPQEPPLHPQSQGFLEAAAEQNTPRWFEMEPGDAREMFNDLELLFGKGPADVTTTDQRVGERIPIRIYRASQVTKPSPVVVYFHGGGWVLGNLETHDAVCRRLADFTPCVVVSVDYRLAPENRYPAAFDDCYEVTRYVAGNAGSLQIDPDRIVVAGDSAGGNLAAAVALKAHNDSGPALLAQVLIYPALDDDCNSESYARYATGYGLTRDDMQWFWNQYRGDSDGAVYFCPAEADSVAGLPPALIITAQYDVLRSEAERYAERLRQAAVPVELKRYDGMLHGFLHFAGFFDTGLEATRQLAADLRERFQ